MTDSTNAFQIKTEHVLLIETDGVDRSAIDATVSLRTNTRVEAVHTNCFVQCSSCCSMFKGVGVVRESRCCAVESGRALRLAVASLSENVHMNCFEHCSGVCSLFKATCFDSNRVVL